MNVYKYILFKYYTFIIFYKATLAINSLIIY